MDIDCCGSDTYTLSPGDQFNFVNYQAQDVQVITCCPPLAALSYTVPAAQNGTPGSCGAQVAVGATGTYTISVSGCSNPPPHGPVIKLST
ncbi:MAG TPA: hypothetical protein VG860_10735 [Terriglobia bacterium]|jgi:hypothetical protein|nr:hypothetical protein [Terriglobia bacterium]